MNNFNTPQETVDALVKKGENKVKLPFHHILILGMLAGAYIGFGAEIGTLVATGTPEHLGYGVTKLLVGAVFSVGLMLVMIAGAELFTGNNLIVKAVVKKKVTWLQLWENLGLVYLANFLGAILLVYLIFYSGLWMSNDYHVGLTALKIADAKVNLDFFPALFRGILCNWLVCLAVVLAVSAKDIVGKIFGIFFPITIFVASGFEHAIANMYYIPMGIFLKGQDVLVNNANLDLSNLTWFNFIFHNLVPVTLGNLIGGIIFVGILYSTVYNIKEK